MTANAASLTLAARRVTAARRLRLLAYGLSQYVCGMPDHHTLLELVKISDALRDALREAYELARGGENGEPLRETLHYAQDLIDLANETLAGDPQAGERARGMAMHMAEQLAAMEALLGPMAAA